MHQKVLLCVILIIFLFCNISSSFAQNKDLEQGIKCFKNKQYTEAVKFLSRVIVKDPNNKKANFYIGLAYKMLSQQNIENLHNALGGLVVAAELMPKDAEVFYQLALVYDELDRAGMKLKSEEENDPFKFAVNAYEEAIRIDKNLVKAYVSLGLLYKRKGKCELALQEFKKALEIRPANVTAISGLVDCLLGQEKYWEAIEKLSELERLRPDDINHSLRIAEIYQKQGQYQNALEKLKEVQQKVPEDTVVQDKIRVLKNIIDSQNKIKNFLQQAENSLRENQYLNAIDEAENVLSIDDQNAKAAEIIQKAKDFYADEKFKQAKKFLNKGDKIKKNELEIAVNLLNEALKYCTTTQKMTIIINEWKKAQESIGKISKVFEVKKRGENFIIQGEYEKGTSYLDVAIGENIEVGPEEIADLKKKKEQAALTSLKNYAFELEKKGQLSDAITFYKEAKRKDSSLEEVAFRIKKLKGDIYFENKDWNNSIYWYESAIADNKELSKSILTPDSLSVKKRLEFAYTKAKIKNRLKLMRYLFLFISVLAISLAICFISKKGFKMSLHDIKKVCQKFVKRFHPIFYAISLIILVSIIIAFPLLKMIFGQLGQPIKIGFLAFLIFMFIMVIFGFIPKNVKAHFKINSSQLTFITDHESPVYISEEENYSFKSLKIENIGVLKVYLSPQVFRKCKLPEGYYEIVPISLETDIDIEIVSQNSNLKLKELRLPKLLFLNIQSKKNVLVFRCKNLSKREEDSLNSCLGIKGSLKMKINTSCKLVDERNHLTAYEMEEGETIDLFYTTKNADITTFSFNILPNAFTVFEFNNIEEKNETEFNLFKNISGSEVGIHDFRMLSQRLKYVSTISDEYGEVSLSLNKKVTEKIGKENLFEIRPNRFKNLKISLDQNKLHTEFNSEIRYLKIGNESEFEASKNIIPDVLQWLLNHNKWGILLPFALSVLFSFLFNALFLK